MIARNYEWQAALASADVFLRSAAAGEGMDCNFGADRIYIAPPDTATVCRADTATETGARRRDFDRVARHRFTSLEKVNRDSMRRSGDGGSRLHADHNFLIVPHCTPSAGMALWGERCNSIGIRPFPGCCRKFAIPPPSTRRAPAPGSVEPQPRVARLNHEGVRNPCRSTELE